MARNYKKEYIKRKKYHSLYRKKHAKKRRNYIKKYSYSLRLKIIKLLGNKCINCGFSDWRALQIDHINGGGSKEKKTTRNYYLIVLENIKTNNSKYQVLCANCNWIKRYENDETALKYK